MPADRRMIASLIYHLTRIAYTKLKNTTKHVITNNVIGPMLQLHDAGMVVDAIEGLTTRRLHQYWLK